MDDRVSYPLLVEGPIFKHGDHLKLIRLHSKSQEGQRLLDAVAARRMVVIGTRIAKRFPAMFDHQEDTYIQMVTVNVEYKGNCVVLSASHFELVAEEPQDAVEAA